jgi:regulatory protein
MEVRGPRKGRKLEPLGKRADAALALALDRLGRRAHSSTEIRRKLLARGAEPEVVAEVLEKLLAWGYLNDEAFAAQRAASLARRGFGSRAVAAKLSAAGVSASLVQGEARRSKADEVELARQALERRLRGARFQDLEPKARQRLLRWLASRGFSAEAIASVHREVD